MLSKNKRRSDSVIHEETELNDSVWFSRFDWNNLTHAAQRVELDICWTHVAGYTFAFLDAHLENGLYVTLGLRQKQNGVRKASMSVFKQEMHTIPGEGFSCNPKGGENDTYCIGDYPFRLGEHYRLIILAKAESVEGCVRQMSTNRITRIATFMTGKGSLIKAQSSNGIALERVGMENPCESKSCIYVSSPTRVDIYGNRSNATKGFVKCEKCLNVDVHSDSKGHVIISHGGDSSKRFNEINEQWISWASKQLP